MFYLLQQDQQLLAMDEHLCLSFLKNGRRGRPQPPPYMCFLQEANIHTADLCAAAKSISWMYVGCNGRDSAMPCLLLIEFGIQDPAENNDIVVNRNDVHGDGLEHTVGRRGGPPVVVAWRLRHVALGPEMTSCKTQVTLHIE